MFLVALNLTCFAAGVFFPIIAVFAELDPFYFIFELILLSPYERSISMIMNSFLARLFLVQFCVVEVWRFAFVIMFVLMCIASTLATCLENITQKVETIENNKYSFNTQLRIVLKTTDFFLRHVIVFSMICVEHTFPTVLWLLLKCWNILPAYVTFVFYLIINVIIAATLLILPLSVKIGDISEIFVLSKTASNHTFNRSNKKYYYYLKWKSLQKLPIRFGVQFILTRQTLNNYFSLLMENITNAVLLVNP